MRSDQGIRPPQTPTSASGDEIARLVGLLQESTDLGRVEALRHVQLAVAAGEHDPRVGTNLVNETHRVLGAHVGHREVENNHQDLVASLTKDLNRFASVNRRDWSKTGATQHRARHASDALVIVHN
jgi:hypothetical protein